VSLVRSGDARGERPPDRTIPTEGNTMSELREYVVVLNGNETTMQLSEEDAKALDAKPVAKPVESKAVAEAPKHKARYPKGR